MAYVAHSTNNPNGLKPWNAVLQPGGLGAFFPNVEGIGSPSVIVDRDAANKVGWKGAEFAGAPVPRIYYPPDARLQYTTPRGMGAVAIVNPLQTRLIGPAPAAIRPVIVLPGYQRAQTNLTNSSTSNVSTTPVAPTAASVSAAVPAITTATNSSGTTVAQQTGATAAQVAGTSVPVGQPLTTPYVDSYGNTWLFNGVTFYNASAQVAGTPVPVGTSTTTTYTDASGNVWTWNGAAWTSATAASASGSSWLESETIIGSVPNYAVLAGAGVVLWFLMKKK